MSSLRNSKAGTRKCPGVWWGEWRSIWNQRSWVLHAALPLTGRMTIHLQLDLQSDLQTLNNKIMLPSSPRWWEDGNQMRESVQKLLKKKKQPSINSTWNVVGVSHSVVSDCLQLHGLKPSRLFCPWDFPDKNTGVDCHFFFFLQRIFLMQRLNPCLLHWQEGSLPLSHLGSPSWNTDIISWQIHLRVIKAKKTLKQAF